MRYHFANLVQSVCLQWRCPLPVVCNTYRNYGWIFFLHLNRTRDILRTMDLRLSWCGRFMGWVSTHLLGHWPDTWTPITSRWPYETLALTRWPVLWSRQARLWLLQGVGCKILWLIATWRRLQNTMTDCYMTSVVKYYADCYKALIVKYYDWLLHGIGCKILWLIATWRWL